MVGLKVVICKSEEPDPKLKSGGVKSDDEGLFPFVLFFYARPGYRR